MIKKVVVIFIALLICGLSVASWLYVPKESGFYWLNYLATTLAIIAIAASGYWLYQQTKTTADKKREEEEVLLKQDIKAIEHVFQLAVKRINGRGSAKLKNLYELPWYVVIGGDKDAKSSMLQQNGIELLTDKAYQEEYGNQFVRFWANDHLVAIEIGSKVFDNENINSDLWAAISQQLLKYRPRQGVNGIISIIGSDRLLTTDRKQRHKISNSIQEAVLTMGNALGLTIPVYSIFTKADAISDFVEFFDYYSVNDVDNPFGVTFEYENSKRFDSYQLEIQIDVILRALAEQQHELLRNISKEQASSIIALPYQLKIFFDFVNELLTDIGRENRVREAVWLRGFYLLSCGQKGLEFDLLSQAVAERMEFNAEHTVEKLPGRRNFFCSKLFRSVVLPEKDILGVNELRNSLYIFSRVSLFTILGGGLLASAVTLKNNWAQDEAWRANTISELRLYDRDIHTYKREHENLASLIDILNEVREVAEQGVTPVPWYKKISSMQDYTAQKIYYSYQDQLKQYLLPIIEKLVRKELTVQVNLENPTRTFEILRYYQMLFDKSRLQINELQPFLLDDLRQGNELNSHNIDILALLIEDLFSSDYENTLEADHQLMANASSRLEGLSAERLIYDQIKNTPINSSQVDIRRQLGENFNTLFEFDKGFHGYLVPEMFTKQGYSQLDLSPKSALLRKQLKEFELILNDHSGVSLAELSDISKKVQKLYFSDYIRYWKNLLQNIKIKNLNSSDRLTLALHNAREPVTSPILDVVSAVVVNTTLAVEEQPNTKENKRVASQLGLTKAAKTLRKVDRINRAVGSKLLDIQPSFVVNKAFKPYSDFINSAANGSRSSSSESFITSIDNLNSYFDLAFESSNPARKMHEYALAHAKGTQDPISDLEQAATRAPEQIHKWANELSAQSWKLVLNTSMSYIAQQWNEQVYRNYVQTIKGRFPFNLNGRGEVALEDFTEFFKPQGDLEQFHDEYLKPFMHWENNSLKLNKVDGYELPIQHSTLVAFEKAKTIKDLFFGAAGQEIALKLKIKPNSMSTGVTRFQIRSDARLFNYAHGPRIWTDLSWPSDNLNGYLSCQFFKGENQVETKSYSGQWGLFRALFSAKSSSTSVRAIRKLQYKIDNEYIDLDYALNGTNNALRTSMFTSFNIPKKIQNF